MKMFDYRPMAGGGMSAGFFKAPEWIVAKNAIVNVQNQMKSASCGQS